MSLELDELVWSAPTSKKPSSGKPKPKWQERKPGVRSLGQTRLDRTWQERSPTQFQEYVRWRNEFRRNPAYTTAWLEAWAQEVALAMPRVQAVVNEPPSTWTGVQWDQAHETLLRLQGQAQAVAQTLKERTQTASFTVDQVYALVGSSYAPGLKPSTCFAVTEPDPFVNE